MANNLRQFLENLGYTDMKIVRGKVCGIAHSPFLSSIVIGLDAAGYELRYFFENEHDARNALKAWDGEGHPPGAWFRFKGVMKGCYVDLRNPGMAPSLYRVAA
ncbi:MAG: hypothetical protein ABFC67_14705 [Mizugakiibacter sp.]|uniref:hypothetical protein n=1 Tax=Mizugakiibacter sp. TaxID=1972610 RepID=UPI00320D382A